MGVRFYVLLLMTVKAQKETLIFAVSIQVERPFIFCIVFIDNIYIYIHLITIKKIIDTNIKQVAGCSNVSF